ncbi:MAG: hypothetical protein ACUVSK_02270 [Desulfotomaculales bacterium]
MNWSRPFLLAIVAGILLGAVIYGWQVSLAGFLETTGLEYPSRLWSLEKIDGDCFSLELLGKKWLLVLPPDG